MLIFRRRQCIAAPPPTLKGSKSQLDDHQFHIQESGQLLDANYLVALS